MTMVRMMSISHITMARMMSISTITLATITIPSPKKPIKRHLRGMIPIKMRRIHLHANYTATRHTQANHHPIKFLSIMPARFPPIVPSARVGVQVRFAHGRRRVEKVGGGGEPFVADGEDFAA